tara:strand:+ start:718 stop:900 length:183 start_codon:yes stop_codon:yes gene_type:complete
MRYIQNNAPVNVDLKVYESHILLDIDIDYIFWKPIKDAFTDVISKLIIDTKFKSSIFNFD